MKKLYLSVLLMLTTIGVFGQYSISFNDTLRPFGSGAYSLDNIQKNDSFYYATGIFIGHLTNYSQQPFVLKFNKSGSLKEKRILLDSNNYYGEYYYNSALLHNSTIFQLVIKTDSLNRDLGTVLSIDKQSLDTLWTKTYAHPDTIPSSQNGAIVFSVLTAIKPAPGGGYILTGNYNKDCITGNLRSFLMKIDSVGNVEWRKTYDDVTGLFDVELTNDGGGVFLNPYGNNVNRVARFDSTGIITWQIQVNTGMTGWSNTSGIRASKNNTVVGVRTYMYNNNISHPYMGFNVFKVDINTKQVLWDKTYRVYKNVQCVSMHQAIGVEALPNGDIIVSGTAKNYGHDAVILKLNSNGDSLWCKSYDFDPDPWDCQLNDLIITEDGGFMGVGFFSDQNGPGWTAWMFKTDENGTIGWESPKFEASRLKIFPNPAHDYTIIELPESLKNTATLKVYNSLGQLVFQKILNKGEKAIKLDVGGFDTGVYFFEIMGEGGFLGSSRFVKE